MWWWEFNKEEDGPIQEDLVVYEKFLEFRADRERMDRDKSIQKERSKQRKLGKSSTKYNIPDSI